MTEHFCILLTTYRHFEHRISKVLKTRAGCSLFLNNSIHVTEHFCILQPKYQHFWNPHFKNIKKTIRTFALFEYCHRCDGAFFAYVKRNINIFEIHISKILKNDKVFHYYWHSPSMWRSIFCIRQPKYQEFWNSHFKSIKKR